MQTLIDERAKARSEKRWKDSDSLREQLESLGLQVKDTSGGQVWS
jgi:cysteinyl-tRNA synthetase